MQPEAARAWIDEQEPHEPDDEGQPTGPAGLPLPIWPENWPVVGLFLRLQTQWRVRPSGWLQGLRYDAVAHVLSLLMLRKRRRLFTHLQEMEQAVLEAQGDD